MRRTVGDHVSAVEHDGAVADRTDLIGVVGDEQDRTALVLERADPVDALRLESFVTNGQHFVDYEDVGVDVDGDREGEAHVHAAGVELHLRIDEVLDLAELHDVVEDPLDHLLGESQHRAVEEDVVATGELRLKSGPELQQRREAAANMDLARRRLQDAADALEQGRLARSVVADESHGLVRVDRETDVLQCVERLGGARTRMEHPLLE